ARVRLLREAVERPRHRRGGARPGPHRRAAAGDLRRGRSVTLRVAQAGIRGVPANFGGSETPVEEIGSRLAASGGQGLGVWRRHKSPFPDAMYKGMRRVVLPSIPTFNFDTISHSTLAALHAVARDSADVVHFHGMGNALCLPLLL